MRISDWSSDVCSSDLDFTAENGATRLWPGSNHAAPDSVLSDDIAKAAVMPRGPAVIFLGSTLHAGGAHRSTQSRSGMTIRYCQAWLKPGEKQWLAYTPEIARPLSPPGKHNGEEEQV